MGSIPIVRDVPPGGLLSPNLRLWVEELRQECPYRLNGLGCHTPRGAIPVVVVIPNQHERTDSADQRAR